MDMQDDMLFPIAALLKHQLWFGGRTGCLFFPADRQTAWTSRAPPTHASARPPRVAALECGYRWRDRARERPGVGTQHGANIFARYQVARDWSHPWLAVTCTSSALLPRNTIESRRAMAMLWPVRRSDFGGLLYPAHNPRRRTKEPAVTDSYCGSRQQGASARATLARSDYCVVVSGVLAWHRAVESAKLPL
ncbi:uncharacterized protein LOC142590735 [Dermacentor variabilis]|uniref:uncharacterized protein LOC142590735 n=1 Tax=Dermacentor variabilis TaxID=34621 RepID=UPI003F5BCB3B